MAKTSYFQQVKDLAHQKSILEHQMMIALHGARVYEHIPWDTLAKESGKSRGTVISLVKDYEATLGIKPEDRSEITIDLSAMSADIYALIRPFIKE